MLEHVGIFHRGIGEGSDVVGKEMYTFADRDGQIMALRPEGTAPIVRAFVQHHPVPPWKAWYAAPSFRHENPQHGRYRQHFQLGVEALGPVRRRPRRRGDLPGLRLHRLARPAPGHPQAALHGRRRSAARLPRAAARTSWPSGGPTLCLPHQERFDQNPLRVLDCKTPECEDATEDAPRFIDNLCEPCTAHFARVRAGLDALDVPYTIDHRLVRGFDYYTRTTFEFASGAIDAAQNALGGGGRYNGLVEMLGGPPDPGHRLRPRVSSASSSPVTPRGCSPPTPPPLHAYVIDVTGGESAVLLTAELRRAGLRVDRGFDDRSMKSQMKTADRSGALVALIIGPKELDEGTVSLRPLRSEERAAHACPEADVVAEFAA